MTTPLVMAVRVMSLCGKLVVRCMYDSDSTLIATRYVKINISRHNFIVKYFVFSRNYIYTHTLGHSHNGLNALEIKTSR